MTLLKNILIYLFSFFKRSNLKKPRLIVKTSGRSTYVENVEELYKMQKEQLVEMAKIFKNGNYK
jgi:hypothetical protein